jgi:7,8-dihydropterin-6-yl-methyl-4-(beta-D-ribofuranosyl)aminobenzene 5'-phosphate synthase
MKIYTLLENTKSDKALTHKHGLSLYIETGSKKILFDTGPDHRFIDNAQKLDIDLSHVDLVFLSHGHADHGGGIPAFQEINKKARIILSQSAMNPFYARLPLGLSKYIGLPKKGMDTDRFEFISLDRKIDENIHVFTRFTQNGFVPKGNKSLKVKTAHGQKIPDDFSHEIALLIAENDTRVLFTGCSHSGVGNMVETVLKRTGLDRIDRVMGGFHLFNPVTRKTESPASVQALVRELSAFPATKFYTGHCTGPKAFRDLKERMKERIFEFKTGTQMSWESTETIVKDIATETK